MRTILVGQRHFESLIRHKKLFRLMLRHSTVPSPPKSGEKVADRPDEGPVQDVNLRKMPPHPSPLPQFVCDHAAEKNHAISANKSGERGQCGAVQLGPAKELLSRFASRTDVGSRSDPRLSGNLFMRQSLVAAILVIVGGCRSEHSKQKPPVKQAPPVTTSFIDISEESNVHFAYHNGRETGLYAILESLGGGCAALDFDRDGNVDIFAPGGGDFPDKNRVAGRDSSLLRRLQTLKWKDVTADAGCAASSFYSHGCAVADADSDGFADIVVTGYGGLQFLKNLGDGTFMETATQARLDDKLWSSSVGWGDLNGDGFADLYVAHYANWSLDNNPACQGGGPDGRDVCPPREFEPLDDVLYLNNGDGSFTDASRSNGLVAGGKGLGVLLADLDQDSDTDIYVANDTTPNFLYQNDGTGNLREIGVSSGTALDDRGIPNGSMGTAVGDFSHDGLPDLWVTNFEMETFALYRNRGHCQFQHVSRDSGVNAIGARFVGFGTVTEDFDLDGDLDIAVANGHVVYYPVGNETAQDPVYLENLGDGVFKRTEPGEKGGYFQQKHVGRGLVTADVDNDGKVDLIVSHLSDPGRVLKNVSKTTGYSIRLELIGVRSNRDGIGAVVTLHTSAGQQVRFRAGGGSYLSHNEAALFFGVPAGVTCTNMTITWPGGVSEDLPLTQTKNQRIVAKEGNPALISVQ